MFDVYILPFNPEQEMVAKAKFSRKRDPNMVASRWIQKKKGVLT